MIEVSSEIGRLRKALVHEPGLEVDRMVPAMMEQLLFDDILHGDAARDEHARFRRVLQLCGVELYDASDLLAEALAEPGAQTWILDLLSAGLADDQRRPLEALSPEGLAAVLVEGSVGEAGALPAAEELYVVPPLPNWCFQRDPQVIVGRGVVFSAMATPARQREALLARAIFRFHPNFRETPVLFDPPEPGRSFMGRERPLLEGGDVLILSPELIAVGLSERTDRNGVTHLARALALREAGPRWLIGVEIPRKRAYMHLDTLITLVDREACLVHAPVLLPGGSEPARIWEIDLCSKDLAFEPRADLFETLARRGLGLEPIPCGGSDPISQQREQWTDGANVLALAPGVITLFDRNLATAEELSRRGFRIVEAEDLLLGSEEVDLDVESRVCILIRSNEISRARGGPHCLVHPLLRDAVGGGR